MLYLLLIIPILLAIPNLKIINKEHTLLKELSPKYREQNYYRFLLSTNDYIKEIKFYNLGKKFSEKFDLIGQDINNKNLKLYRQKSTISIIINIIILIIIYTLQYQCVKNTINGISDVGQLLIYFQTISKVDSIIQDIMTTSFSLYQVLIYIEHLYTYLNINMDENYIDGSNIDTLRRKNNTITFKNVSFKYPNNSMYTIKNINFEVKQGDIVAIIGENGSGKSTLLNLLLRLYNVYDGEILYNNISINDINLEQWRDEFKVTCQDFIKYEFQLKDNIAIKDNESGVNHDKIDKIIKILNLKSIIRKLPNGIKSQLGLKFKDGRQLSIGEWQKIAIARSLYKTGRVLFWDEPSSALDSESEENIFNASINLIKNQEIDFIFYITHNLDNIKYANKILHFKDGEFIVHDKNCYTDSDECSQELEVSK